MLNSGKSLESLAPTVTEVRQPASRLRPRHWLPRVSSRKCVGVRVSRSAVSDPETPWTAACQAPLSMGLSRQEYWSGLPFPSPGDLPDPGIKASSLAVAGGCLSTEPPGKPLPAHEFPALKTMPGAT